MDPGAVSTGPRCGWAEGSDGVRVLCDPEEWASFDALLRAWVDGTRVVNRPRAVADLIAHPGLLDRLSQDLEWRGCTGVGSTFGPSSVQAVGMDADSLAGRASALQA